MRDRRHIIWMPLLRFVRQCLGGPLRHVARPRRLPVGRSRGVRIAAWLGCLACLSAGGCSMGSMMQNRDSAWAPTKAPTGRITQTDVATLNDAVATLAKSEDPRRYEEASKKLAELLPRFEAAGENECAAEAMFWLAYCYEKTNRKPEAAVFYDQLVQKYPQTRAAEEAKARRQRLQFSRPSEAPPKP